MEGGKGSIGDPSRGFCSPGIIRGNFVVGFRHGRHLSPEDLIARGAWTLYAVCSSDKRCPLEELLADQSELGGDKEGEIRQTEQGRVRVLWFFDKGRLILCSHGFIKSSQKTPEREKGIARRAFEEYHAAKSTGSLVFLEE